METYSYSVIHYDFLPDFLKYIYIYIGVFNSGLLQHFIGIAILTCLVRLANKITLARVPAAC